jgi:Fur family iron response transcriptional regulator
MHHKDEIVGRLRSAGLRPTAQRAALARLLFTDGHRHVTAEKLHAEASTAGIALSLATVYNALNDFTAAGIIRVLAVEGSRTWFDTNTSEHHHFYLEGDGEIVDMVDGGPRIRVLPDPPEGYEIANVEIVVRLRTNRSADPAQRPARDS